MGADEPEIRLEAAGPRGHEATKILQQMRAEARSRYGDILDASEPMTNDPLVARSASHVEDPLSICFEKQWLKG
jgi:hypothetical protein